MAIRNFRPPLDRQKLRLLWQNFFFSENLSKNAKFGAKVLHFREIYGQN